MNFLSYLKLTALFLFMGLNLVAQSKSGENCGKDFKGFIYDTQEYIIDPTEESVFDVVFYPGFVYRLGLCTDNTKIQLEFLLVDEKANEQYKNIVAHGFFRDFDFDTVFHGKIRIKPVEMDSKQAQLIIGYKKKKN